MPTDLDELLRQRQRARDHLERQKRQNGRDLWIGMGVTIGLLIAAALPLMWLVIQWINGRF
jgi:tetrahydromethanopterin S-methyltransferase subunit G